MPWTLACTPRAASRRSRGLRLLIRGSVTALDGMAANLVCGGASLALEYGVFLVRHCFSADTFLLSYRRILGAGGIVNVAGCISSTKCSCQKTHVDSDVIDFRRERK